MPDARPAKPPQSRKGRNRNTGFDQHFDGQYIRKSALTSRNDRARVTRLCAERCHVCRRPIQGKTAMNARAAQQRRHVRRFDFGEQ